MPNADGIAPSPERLSEIQPFLGGKSFDEVWQAFETQGYCVFENVIQADMIEEIRAALAPHFDKQLYGRNDFEGLKSFRQYALLSKGAVFSTLAMHPLVMAFVEQEFGKSALLSAFLAIELHPGETVQPWHCDDEHCRMARPRPPFQLSAFWAIDETTRQNGATQIIPRSHLWDEDLADDLLSSGAFEKREIGDVDDDPQPHPEAQTIELPAGALMLAKGTLYHRGGANKSDGKRLILTPQYNPGWVRSLENLVLSTPPEVVATLPQRVRELIGYSIHPPFMGYVDGVHPQKALDKVTNQ